jgi:hypothetical protein
VRHARGHRRARHRLWGGRRVLVGQALQGRDHGVGGDLGRAGFDGGGDQGADGVHAGVEAVERLRMEAVAAATEMKTLAKQQPGSTWAVDRRAG